MPINNELIDTTDAELTIRMREQQIKVMGAFIYRQAKWITCLLPMLIASVIVNLYFAYRFF